MIRCSALCNSVTGEDRWPVSAPLAEGAQPRAGERTLDKRGGSEGKGSWVFPVLDRKKGRKLVTDMGGHKKVVLWGVQKVT